MVFKMDQKQGIPDLLVLYRDKWATLECKKFAGASRQANQSDYVGMMDHMSFSRFIEPSNKEEVLRELQQAFKPWGAARLLGGQHIPLAELRPKQTDPELQ